MDYSTLKTPYYKISVADSTGQNFIELPKSMMQLVERVEILETFQSETCMHGKIGITFIEGSREPFFNNEDTDTTSVYGSGAKLTNKTGLLGDLRFQGQGNQISLTSFAANAVGQVAKKASNLIGAVAGLLGGGQITETFGNQKSPEAVKYVFQERNMIKVEWGYREDSKLKRVVQAPIVAIQYDFYENDMPRMNITCLETSYSLDQLSVGVGTMFGSLITTGVSPEGTQLKEFSGLTVTQIVNDIATKVGMQAVTSKNFLNESATQGTGFILNPDESVHQFLVKLAKTTHSYYQVKINPKTNRETIYFIAKNEMDSTLFSPDDQLLRYRGKNSILKSVSINADFGGINGNRVAQIDKNGNEVVVDSRDPISVGLFEGAQLVDTDATSNNPIKSAQSLQKQLAKTTMPVSRTEVAPARKHKAGIRESSQANTGCQSARLISMEFTTIGFPNLIPGTHRFSGLGERYSGEYHIIAVTHTLDKDGYTCRGTGQSSSIFGKSGVEYQSPTKGSEQPKTTDVQLFQKFSNVKASDIGKPAALANVTILEPTSIDPGDDLEVALPIPMAATEQYKKNTIG
jgi:hypothetical protein